MRRLLLLVGLAAALTIPAIVLAAARTDGTLSIKRGRATIGIKLVRGTVIGRLANGQVKIKDVSPYDGAPPEFLNCRRRRYPNPSTTVCIGRRISFRALDGRFVINLKGTGIFLSAVGRGTVSITGAADPSIPNGAMSIDNGPYQPIPDFEMTFPLGSSAP
jgi:hypothetical protein